MCNTPTPGGSSLVGLPADCWFVLAFILSVISTPKWDPKRFDHQKRLKRSEPIDIMVFALSSDFKIGVLATKCGYKNDSKW